MCTFDAPIARCETMHQMVLLDETRKECACEHGCPPGQICPLAADFARRSGLYEAHPEIGARSQPRVHATMPCTPCKCRENQSRRRSAENGFRNLKQVRRSVFRK